MVCHVLAATAALRELEASRCKKKSALSGKFVNTFDPSWGLMAGMRISDLGLRVLGLAVGSRQLQGPKHPLTSVLVL